MASIKQLNLCFARAKEAGVDFNWTAATSWSSKLVTEFLLECEGKKPKNAVEEAVAGKAEQVEKVHNPLIDFKEGYDSCLSDLAKFIDDKKAQRTEKWLKSEGYML